MDGLGQIISKLLRSNLVLNNGNNLPNATFREIFSVDAIDAPNNNQRNQGWWLMAQIGGNQLHRQLENAILLQLKTEVSVSTVNSNNGLQPSETFLVTINTSQ